MTHSPETSAYDTDTDTDQTDRTDIDRTPELEHDAQKQNAMEAWDNVALTIREIIIDWKQ